MKKLILILSIISCTSWAHTLKCLYTQQGVDRPLPIKIEIQNNEVVMAKYTPYGIRYQTFANAEVYEDQDFLQIVWDQTETDQFEMTIKKTGDGLINFIKSIHGPHIGELRCEKLGIQI